MDNYSRINIGSNRKYEFRFVDCPFVTSIMNISWPHPIPNNNKHNIYSQREEWRMIDLWTHHSSSSLWSVVASEEQEKVMQLINSYTDTLLHSVRSLQYYIECCCSCCECDGKEKKWEVHSSAFESCGMHAVATVDFLRLQTYFLAAAAALYYYIIRLWWSVGVIGVSRSEIEWFSSSWSCRDSVALYRSPGGPNILLQLVPTTTLIESGCSLCTYLLRNTLFAQSNWFWSY